MLWSASECLEAPRHAQMPGAPPAQKLGVGHLFQYDCPGLRATLYSTCSTVPPCIAGTTPTILATTLPCQVYSTCSIVPHCIARHHPYHARCTQHTAMYPNAWLAMPMSRHASPYGSGELARKCLVLPTFFCVLFCASAYLACALTHTHILSLSL